MSDMILDGDKLPWHLDRIIQWRSGMRIAPVTIDMALTRQCDASCGFCYAMLQENDRHEITWEVMNAFLEDSARMGVRGISLVSDGESLLSPCYGRTITRGHSLGISMASGTNGFRFDEALLQEVLPALTYLRINFSAGTRERYAEIMGVKEAWYDRVTENIRTAVRIKRKHSLPVTIGIQMVLMPQDADQILPFAQLGLDLGVDYAVIKHCSDDEYGNLGIDYNRYRDLDSNLRAAEHLSTKDFRCVVKWSKINEEGTRSYQRCYGAPFMIQISGSGLVAPCGMLFNDRYAKFHIGNICEDRWWDIWQSPRYWEVMDYLASDEFNAQKSCGTLCLQHRVNTSLDQMKKGNLVITERQDKVEHVNFI